MTLQLTEYPSREALMQGAAERMAAALNAGIGKRGHAAIALSGGGTPEPAYRLLAQQQVDWSKVTLALVDERFVPPTSEHSNEALVRRSLAPAIAAGARLAPMYADVASLEAAAERADALYAPLELDFALMGMGGDGHTASWFPGTPGLTAALDPANPNTVIAVRAPLASGTPERLTLTLAAVARAGETALLITGEDKRARLAQALKAPLAEGPAAALFAPPMRAPSVLWAA